jgi:hypothetical protein
VQHFHLMICSPRSITVSIKNLGVAAGDSASFTGIQAYIHTLLCGTRSLMAMESRAIAGGLSADHQLPGVPKAKEVLLNKLIHNHSIDPAEIVTQ